MKTLKSFTGRITTGIIIINLFVYLMVGLSLYQLRITYDQQVELSTQNLARSLELSISKIIDKIDVALLGIVDEAEKQLAAGKINQQSLNAFIALRHKRISELDNMRMAKPDGLISYGSPAPAAPLQTIADREYFIELRNNPKAGLVISKPVKGRITGKWVLIVARRVNNRDGSFGGVAYGSLTLEYLAKMFSSIDIGKHGSITMRDKDLAIVVRHPETNGVCSNIGMTNVSKLFRELVESGQTSKTYKAIYPVDNIERNYTYRKIADYPLYINVGQAPSDYLAPWRKEAAAWILLSLVFTVVTLVSARLLHKQRKSEMLAMERLRSISLYTRNLIEASLDPLVTISKDGKIRDVNEATVNATGITKENLIGSDFSNYFTDPDYARAGYEKVFSQGSVTDYPLTIRHSSGNITNVLYNASLYKDEKGDVAGVFAAARDVTRLKQTEEEIRKLNEELEERVVMRTAELRKTGLELQDSQRALINMVEDLNGANDKLNLLNADLLRQKNAIEAANQELEAFSYSVSHDLRAPLRAIDGFSLAVLEDYTDKLDEEGKNYLNRIRAASQRMSQLIDDILGLSRLGRSEINITSVDLGELAAEITEDLKKIYPDRQVETIIQKGIMVKGDRRLLRIALENLFSNAWKFTNSRPEARVEFGVAKTDNGPVCYVKDNGAGFDEAYADKLFTPFQRLHSTEEFPGTGIGLTTVKRIILRHGGRIWAESEQGKGAAFYFTI